MTVVHTQYGPGEIVASDCARGRMTYKVAGPGFEVWVDETQVPPRQSSTHQAWAPVDHDNSVDLPYNPDPQYPAIPGDVESTIQPIHQIDADERLDSVDSITFEHRTYDEGEDHGSPGPNPELFAKGASLHYADYEDEGEFGGPPQGPPPGPPQGGGGQDPMELLQSGPGWEQRTIPELIDEATALLHMHPDWAQRPMGDLVSDPAVMDASTSPEQGPMPQGPPPMDEQGPPPEQGPPEQGPPEDSGESEAPSDEGDSEDSGENPFGSEEGGEDDGGDTEESDSADESGGEDDDSEESESESEDSDESDSDESDDECECDHDDDDGGDGDNPFAKESFRLQAGDDLVHHQVFARACAAYPNATYQEKKAWAAAIPMLMRALPAIAGASSMLGGGGGGAGNEGGAGAEAGAEQGPLPLPDAMGAGPGGPAPLSGGLGLQPLASHREAWQALIPLVTRAAPFAEKALKAKGLQSLLGGDDEEEGEGGGKPGYFEQGSQRALGEAKNEFGSTEAKPLPLPALGRGFGDLPVLKNSGIDMEADWRQRVRQHLTEHPMDESGYEALAGRDWLAKNPAYMDDPDYEHTGSYRPAGLDDRYIDLQASADHFYDPVTMFRDDPVGTINRIGHVMDEGLNPRFAEYVAQVDSDPSIREAAWKDVRAKALRLRREGHVQVEDVGPDRIYATVKGDHGVYDVMIAKKGAFGGIGGGHAISNWRCACEWGKWAFRRRYTYVGRLCSHGYAAYLEMQSQHTKGKGRLPRQTPYPKRKRADILPQATGAAAPMTATETPPATSTGGAPTPGSGTQNGPQSPAGPGNQTPKAARRKRSDSLQMVPQRLVPELVINDQDDAQQLKKKKHETVDVTEDERKTTGPGQIVHFSKIMAECDRTGAAYPRELVGFLLRYAETADPPAAPEEDVDVTDTDVDDTGVTDTGVTPPKTPDVAGAKTDATVDTADTSTATNTTPGKPKTDEQKLEDEKKDNAAQDANAAPGSMQSAGQPPGGGMGDMGAMMGLAGGLGGGMGDMIPALGDAATQFAPMVGDIAGGVGNMVGDLVGGLGGEIFGHKLAAADNGYPDPLPDHLPFNGSGPQPPLDIGSSADHMDGIDYVDVTDLGDYDPSEAVFSGPVGQQRNRQRDAARYVEADELGGGVANDSGANSGGVGGVSGSAGLPTMGFPGDATGGITRGVGTGLPGGTQQFAASAHYADAVGGDDQTTQDWKVEGIGEAAPDLRWLRDEAASDQEDNLGNMADHVDEVQEHVMDAREHGVDASPFVASRGGLSGIKRAGKERTRAPVVPEVVRVYGGQQQRVSQAPPDIPDPYAPKTAASYDEPDTPGLPAGGDIVAQFQRSAAAQEMLGSSSDSGGGADDFDISGAAQAHLQKTAGRNFSLAEQHELMHERHPLGARNLDSLDLAGTHYEAENSVGLW